MDASIRQILILFHEEIKEGTPLMANALVRAQDSDSPAERREHMAEVYRFAHGMKGNASTLAITDVVELAHAMETALQPFRDGATRITSQLARQLLTTQDLVLERLRMLAVEDPGPPPDLSHATAELLRLTGEPATGEEPTPSPEPEAPRSAAPSPEPTSRDASAAVGATIRISAARLAAVDSLVDELREIRATLEHRAGGARRILWMLDGLVNGHFDPDQARACCHQLQSHYRGLSADVSELADRLTHIDEELRHVRMLPLESIVAPLVRSVWEHAQSVGKRARLEVTGGQVALDRRLLEALKEPLLHLVRNAVDHGIELPEGRQATRKHAQGVVSMDIEQRGAKVHLRLRDDGAGVDLTRVRAKAVERGLVSAEAAPLLADPDLYELLFAPGFSTAAEVTRTSGRGVGLDVVRENVNRVGGKVTVASIVGRGTEFLLELPLSLATAEALVFECAGHVMALPLSSVAMAHYLSAGADTTAIDFEQQLLPLQFLPQLLDPGAAPPVGTAFPVVIIRASERLLALRVDRLLGSRDVVVRPIPPELARMRHLTGATSLGDGKLVFMLNPPHLVELSRSDSRPAPQTRRSRHRVLVADDSITTRSLHRQVLEAAGFEVTTASDGEEALRAFNDRGADLIVSDVNMPRLDGLGLARSVRGQSRNNRVPIILISSLDSDADLKRANDAGASAYLTKASYQGGELLKLVRQLLPESPQPPEPLRPICPHPRQHHGHHARAKDGERLE